MEQDIKDLYRAGIAVEILVPAIADDEGQIGVRLRTFGKQLPPKRMVMGEGPTVVDALVDAIGKAQARRWERLEWASRPWPVHGTENGSDRNDWGLL